MKFDELNLVNQELKTVINVNDKEIEIKHYLPIEKKNNLIQIAIQQSTYENGFINDILFDTYMHLYIVFFYSNLEFTDEQKENALDTYDILQSNGLISEIEAGIPKEEYEELLDFAETYLEQVRKYNVSVVSIINSIIGQLPQQIEKVTEVVNNIDPNKYKEIIDFAKGGNK